jgi:hypothetical protein
LSLRDSLRWLRLGALSLAQVDDKGNALLSEFAEGCTAHKHGTGSDRIALENQNPAAGF